MNIIKFIVLALGLAACAHVDKVTVPQDCNVFPSPEGQGVYVVCPHRISVKH